MTRGGSQDDPVQLLRDLQDAMEREADMREQLRFAEEEASYNFIISNQNYDQHLNSRLTLIGHRC